MEKNGQRIDHCIVGEPTSFETFGDMIKVGRRGSLNVVLEAHGTSGHVAYPQRASNPVTALGTLLHRLASKKLDDGTEYFDPSTLAITTIDVGNPTTNVIPAVARARFNIRFNDAHTSSSLIDWIIDEIAHVPQETGVVIISNASVSGESFLTQAGEFTNLIASVLRDATGANPEFSTSGGTSDARFMTKHCPVIELGLTGLTMHKVDERVSVKEINQLASVYLTLLHRYFASTPTT